MAARRPTTLTVDGHTVTIEWDSSKLGRLAQGYPVKGDHVKGKIRVADGMTDYMTRVTVIHEILHELMDLAGSTLPTKDEEYVFNSIDEWLFRVLDENPALRKFLFGADK